MKDKTKIMNQFLKIKPMGLIILGFISVLCLVFSVSRLTIRALETDEMTPTMVEENKASENDDELPDDEDLKAIKDEVQEKVQERLLNIVMAKKAVVGILKQINNSTLEIETEKGNRLATVNEETMFLDQRKGEKEIELEDLELEQQVIAMGYIENDDEVLDTKRLVIIPELELENRLVVYGQVEEMDDETITLTSPINEQSWQVNWDRKTDWVVKEEGEFVEGDEELVTEGSRVIVAGIVEGEADEDENLAVEANEIEARLIFVYPDESEKVSPTPEVMEE